MNILFVHQNFPGQFKFLAPALAKRGHQVVAMSLKQTKAETWQGVRLVPYSISGSNTPNLHPWLTDFESKIIRGQACFRAAEALKEGGFNPDIIVAHPGWGESLFLKQVWPQAKLGIYCEFFYHSHGFDVGYDPEFPPEDPEDACRIQLKNTNNLQHFQVADAGLCPTHWQASSFPEPFKGKITVIHDGIDTEAVAPDAKVSLTLNNSIKLSRRDEVITFVNRNLEPYRGFHIFMRALPAILKRRPKARILILGGDERGYGANPEGDKSWKEIFIAEQREQISDTDWRRVHFLGRVPYNQFIPLLQISTVHIYLTYPFVLSWSLLEAMSAGCAIVASDTPPVAEAIRHDETGRLVNFFKFEQIVEQVCQLLDDRKSRARLGSSARKFARENYDLKKVCLPRQLEWVESLVTS
jgi:glycosyltransferase involved in cell wall biosynthesis